MRLPTLMSLALAAFVSGAMPALAAPPEGQPTERPAAERTQAAATPAQNVARAGERRRRTSYAACNRESHRRNLYGGARRRFLIRCRLGYERRPGPSAPARRP
ncbi:hypothetical protein ASG52_08655 [Methylobacterium sp. Leaf456]|uniref:hypothetical protein n=1 Tax=Methylobacterium sp. Leaf456 TaxID=1736382 RepID=UPI0006F3E7FA|nr:hypothetical protein [Methylobacterium sp. Leaf456]KQT50119.1 hypothetical protein ASG52_08655 [Methylobacterium sp. Leaf456]